MSEPVFVTTLDTIAPYAGPHAIPGIAFRPIRGALGVSAWGMNVLDLAPHAEGYPEHDHTADGQEEVYLVLEGEVVLLAGGAEHVLSAGHCARVEPGVRRKLVTRERSARILALGGTPGRAFTPTL